MRSDELYHYGVKGMRWGSRKNSRSKTKSIKKKRRNDIKRRREMSDQELQDRVQRLTLEKKYRDMARDDVSAGRKFVSKTLSSAATKAAASAATGAMAYGLYRVLSKEPFDPAKAASYMAPNPHKKK